MFNNEFGQYSTYPFDTLNFKYRFETSHFELKDENKKSFAVIRFDFMPTMNNPVSWKEDVDELPEFDIDFGTVNTENGYEVSDYFSVVQENKPHKFKDADGKEQKTDCYYYPGFIFNFSIIRDPWPKIQRAFLPSIILGIFLYCTFDLTG